MSVEEQHPASDTPNDTVRRWSAADPQVVVVIVHGFGEHSGRYRHVAEALVAAGAAVSAPDLHAHGLAAAPDKRAQFDDLAPLVADVDSAVKEAQDAHPDLPLVLIGHSLGGLVATRYVQQHGSPDGLVLSGPFIGGNPAFEGLLALDPMPDVPIDPAALSRDPSVGEGYLSDPLVYHGPLPRPTLAAVVKAVGEAKQGPGFGRLPVLWLHGENDPLAPLEVTEPVVRKLAGDQLESHVYPGAMHEIFNETNKDEVISDLVAFLNRVRSAARA